MPRRESTDEVHRIGATRFWTPAQANGRLPELGVLLGEMRTWVERLRVVHAELHRLRALWGREIDARDIPDRRHKDRLDQEWRALSRRLEETLLSLREEGIRISDLEEGLVDFYARRRGEVVFLCWRRGEDRIGFYHSLEGGFRGRRPLSDRGRDGRR
ncbi:MAG: DUF2203 domain-containing protein [Thermoplasmata archaeon]